MTAGSKDPRTAQKQPGTLRSPGHNPPSVSAQGSWPAGKEAGLPITRRHHHAMFGLSPVMARWHNFEEAKAAPDTAQIRQLHRAHA